MEPSAESRITPVANPSRSFSFNWLLLSVFLSIGYGSVGIYLLIPFNYIFAFLPLFLAPYITPVLWLTLVIIATRALYRRTKRQGPRRAIIAAEVLIFVVLPLVGTFFDWSVGGSCIETDCDMMNVHRPFALPQLLHLWSLHGFTVIAYAISRKRVDSLRPLTEVVVIGAMGVGCVLQIALGIQLSLWLVYGIAGAPVILCASSPVFALVLFVLQMRSRIARNAHPADVAVQAAGVATGLLGLYSLIEAVLGKHKGAVFDVFTRTCGHTLSQLPIMHQPCSGHYLCTVAACGHPKLVGPLRFGLRRGEPIVVNRQLAVANAFEDLLHERFPRFGSVARRVYDCLGLPLSRWIRHRLLADIVYLLMKPAELAFYMFLLLVDAHDPEERLARMYPWNP